MRHQQARGKSTCPTMEILKLRFLFRSIHSKQFEFISKSPVFYGTRAILMERHWL
jgi:hypothetical protein